MVDREKPGVDSRDEGKHTGRNDLLCYHHHHQFNTYECSMNNKNKTPTIKHT